MERILSIRLRRTLLLVLVIAISRTSRSSPEQTASVHGGENKSGIITELVCPTSKSNPRNSEGDVVVLEDGRLLLAYSEFSASVSDNAPARISAKISDDRGRSWGEKFVLAENKEGLANAMIASFLRLHDGRIMLGYNKKVSLEDTRYYVRFSDDEGQRWSKEISVMAKPAYGAVYNSAPIQLNSGRILAPYSYSPDVEKENHFRVKVYYSDDGGQNWAEGKTVIDLPKRGAMEPGLVELKDGSILMHLRTQLGRVYKSNSSDQGVTWSEPQPMPLKNPESPTAMARIPSTGDLLVIFNNNYNPKGLHHFGARRPLTAAISRDEGETWSHFHNIVSDPAYEYAYPSITFMDDRVLLTYDNARVSEQGKELRREFVFRSIPLKWFYEVSDPEIVTEEPLSPGKARSVKKSLESGELILSSHVIADVELQLEDQDKHLTGYDVVEHVESLTSCTCHVRSEIDLWLDTHNLVTSKSYSGGKRLRVAVDIDSPKAGSVVIVYRMLLEKRIAFLEILFDSNYRLTAREREKLVMQLDLVTLKRKLVQRMKCASRDAPLSPLCDAKQ